jgi:hypothetical protein
MLSNKEIRAMDRYAAAFEEFTKASNSKAGQDMRKERLILEEAYGGAATLKKANEYLAEAEATAKQIVLDAKTYSVELDAASQAARERAGGELDKQQKDLDASWALLKAQEKVVRDLDANVKARGAECAKLEKELAGRKASIANSEAALSRRETAVAAREVKLDARDARIREAVA